MVRRAYPLRAETDTLALWRVPDAVFPTRWVRRPDCCRRRSPRRADAPSPWRLTAW